MSVPRSVWQSVCSHISVLGDGAATGSHKAKRQLTQNPTLA